MFKKRFLVHPFLFALFPILFLYSHNIDEVFFPQILLPAAASLGLALLLFLFLRWILRDAEKAAIIVSVFLILFFSYGHVLSAIRVWHIKYFYKPKHLIIAWGVILGYSTYLVIRKSKSLFGVTTVANIIAVSLVAISLVNVGFHRAQAVYSRKDDSGNGAGRSIPGGEGSSSAPAQMRDIYYIILDAYASSDTLREVYEYDNSDFTNWLSDKGFYIGIQSRSNYAVTFLSLASSLNMEYVNRFVDQLGPKSKEHAIFYKMIENSNVMNFLKARGYKIILFRSGWEGTNANRYADMQFSCGWVDEFMMVLIQTTAMDYFLGRKLIEYDTRQRVLRTFSKLAEVPRMEGPKFIFVHFMCPHPPYLFDADGAKLSKTKLEMDGREWSKRNLYLKQLRFVNKKVKSIIEQIFSCSKVPPIIILQADHGSASLGRPSPPLEMTAHMREILQERLRIFNAYCLPGQETSVLHSSITPVNTFRVVFNMYFNTNYELLEERCYYGNYEQPYILTDVTDEVSYDGAHRAHPLVEVPPLSGE